MGSALLRVRYALLSLMVMAAASAQAAPQTVTVLIKPIAPFVMQRPNGTPSGFSIELWEALADRMGLQTRFVMLPDLKTLLHYIEAGEGDAAIAAISITSDREARIDFSHPYFDSGLQILVAAAEMGALQKAFGTLRRLTSTRGFWSAFLTLGLLLVVFAHVIWFIERDRNPSFARRYPAGLWDAVYWALVTVTTVGYGDKTPKSAPGQAVAIVLIFFGYLTFAWFTATVASALTVSQLEGAVRGPEDLSGKQVATVTGSTAERFLRHLPGVRVATYPLIEGAYPALLAGEVDAVLYDYPSLAYYAQNAGRGKVRLVGPIFQHEAYGIAFPEGSPLRERVNRALLEIREEGLYDRIYAKWFGATGP